MKKRDKNRGNLLNTYKSLERYKFYVISLSATLIGTIFLFASISIKSPDQENLKKFLETLGTVFIPSGIISLVNEFFMKESFLYNMKVQLLEVSNSLKIQEKLGLHSVESSMPLNEIIDVISTAKNNVYILQTWIPDIQNIENSIVDAALNGAKIEILILDPTSSIAGQRALDLGYLDPNAGSRNIESNIFELSRIVNNHNIEKNLEVRFYTNLPSVHMYAGDDKVFVGIFWHGIPSKLGMSIEIHDSRSLFGSLLEKEFQAIWSTATPANLGSNQNS